METVINFFMFLFGSLAGFLLFSIIIYFIAKWLIKLYLSDWIEMINVIKTNFGVINHGTIYNRE